MTKSIIQLATAVLLLGPVALSAQVTIGGTTPDASAVVDMQSTEKGFLWPKLSTSERNAMISPATGLIIFNANTLCIEINQGTPSVPQWERVKCRTGIISSLNCAGASVTGLTIEIPYTGGNGGVFDSQSAASTGITGLSATLTAGNYANGSGSLSWAISGVPSGPGTANFSLSSGGLSCSVPFTVVAGTIIALNCSGATVTGTLNSFLPASGVSASVPYTGGNGGFHGGQTVTSTGVTGLTATLSAGGLNDGAGTLTYTVTGTPSSDGTAIFALNIGGQTCTLNMTVSGPVCRAKVNDTVYRNFMCYNLGAASTSVDPFTPGWENNGGYWQWGRLAQAAEGPTATDPKDGAVSGWNTTGAANGSWADGSKTANDPCPVGYRVPTRAQWVGAMANNIITNVGTFSYSATNYGAGKKIGNQLMLPAAGFRNYVNSTLGYRGYGGHYWSSAENFGDYAWFLYFESSVANTLSSSRTSGLSVRCIEDTPGSVGAINCSGATVTGTLNSGQAASGVSVSVPYTGGVAGPHSGQTVTSTGVTGLTATLSAGGFDSGAGSLSYSITGTPASAGTASFALNIGGQTCALNVSVAYVCRAKVTATDYKDFMCHNLGAANFSADPFTLTWEINGGYWQWGRSAQAAEGPTATDPKGGAISGWNTTDAANGSWADGSKTGNDPCPAGYRVPTKEQWVGVIANNTKSDIGTFNNSDTNYGAGVKFGNQLMLPAAGYRIFNDGAVSTRGYLGAYWSSTEYDTYAGFRMGFTSGINANMANYNRTFGLSVRCIAE